MTLDHPHQPHITILCYVLTQFLSSAKPPAWYLTSPCKVYRVMAKTNISHKCAMKRRRWVQWWQMTGGCHLKGRSVKTSLRCFLDPFIT